MSKRGQEIFVFELVYIIWGNKNFKEINIINDTRYIIALIEFNASLALLKYNKNIEIGKCIKTCARDVLFSIRL